MDFRFILTVVLSVFLSLSGSSDLYAQKAKKNKVRINVSYVKIMDGKIYFDIKTSARVDKKTVAVPNIELTLSNDLDDEKVILGKTKTNMDGKSRFTLKGLNEIKADSSNTYNVSVSFKGNDDFKKAKKSISFKDVDISAKMMTKDSVNYVTAVLTDAATEEPLTDQSLTVKVQRLFKGLKIGDEFNSTDEDGAISVAVEEGIPGVDGNLTFEVSLDDSDDYGTVKAMVTAPVGVPIVDESTFDQRTMWSPRGKTPLFLLFITYIAFFVVWGIFVYLVSNLFKIYKS